MNRVALGTQGWSYADWVGPLYVPGSRPESYLRTYAEEFSSVEVDSTFYGPPSPERVRRWAAQVPAGFTFALKLPREITHERRLLAPEAPLAEFLAGALAFEEKLEAVLIQMPPDFTPAELDALERFVAVLPAGPRWALELRDADFFHGEPHRRLRDALGAHGVALAVTDGPYVPLETMLHELHAPTASHGYLRWLGVQKAIPRFDAIVVDRSAEIARWAEALRAAAPNLARVSGYASNQYAGHAPQTVRDIAAAFGLPHDRPKHVEQPSLFDASP